MQPSRHRNRDLSAATSALALFALAALVAAPAPCSTPYEIHLLTSTLSPPAGLAPTARQALASRAATLAAAGQRRMHVLLQLHHLPRFADRQALWQDGIDLGTYASGSTWIASIPTARVMEIAAHPAVRWLTPWDATLKVHPRARAGDWAPWAQHPEQPGWVMVLLQLHHDVPLSRGQSLATAVGGVPLPPVDGLHGLTLWLPSDRLETLAAQEEVLWIEEGPPPLTPTNDGVRDLLAVNTVAAAPFSLDGNGVRLFVFDGDAVRATHSTFDPGAGSRVTVIDGTLPADHATHVAGTAAGDGNGGRARGVAPGASLISASYEQVGGSMPFWDNAGDIEVDFALARNLHDADLTTASLGSNTARDGFPCSREGDYGVSASLIDGIVRGDNGSVGSAVLTVWAAGNERIGGAVIHGRCGANYATMSPPACAKNPIHIGGVNSDGGAMTTFSSWGPCDDGRLKPLLVSPACEVGRGSGEAFVFSSLNGSDNAFGGSGWCGTSMAAPGVAGIATLFVEDWRAAGHGGADDRPLPALVRAMLIHTAVDLGQEGPDFIHGYGLADATALISLLRAGSSLGSLPPPGAATSAWGTDTIDQGEVDTFNLEVPAGSATLRASLAWDDAPAAAFAADAAVNDLDLELASPSGSLHRPWVLDAGTPTAPATTGINSIDNQEQVVVEAPAAGTWTVRVRGTAVPEGPQTYGLVYEAAPRLHDTACAVSSWGFETNLSPWVGSGLASRAAAPAPGHGAFSLQLGGGAGVGDAHVEVAVPADAGLATLDFWWYMTTAEGPSHTVDFFLGEVRDTAGTVLSVFDLRSDGWPQATWMETKNVDLTPWAGQTIRLAVRANNNASLPTTFHLDDVTLTTCPAIAGFVFGDGFESGDTTAWSVTVP